MENQLEQEVAATENNLEELWARKNFCDHKICELKSLMTSHIKNEKLDANERNQAIVCFQELILHTEQETTQLLESINNHNIKLSNCRDLKKKQNYHLELIANFPETLAEAGSELKRRVLDSLCKKITLESDKRVSIEYTIQGYKPSTLHLSQQKLFY